MDAAEAASAAFPGANGFGLSVFGWRGGFKGIDEPPRYLKHVVYGLFERGLVGL